MNKLNKEDKKTLALLNKFNGTPIILSNEDVKYETRIRLELKDKLKAMCKC